MTYNRITAEIGESRRITTRPISYQYDTVQILMLTAAEGVELPEFYQVDFCVIGDEDTVTMVGSLSGGALIPDSLLRQGENLMAYLVLTGTESDAQTRYEITIPVNERPTRSGIELSDDQQAQVDSLVEALNEGVDRAEAAAEAIQDMGVEAETLAPGSPLTVTKEVDPETGAVTLIFGLTQGPKGDDGYSPTITITEITGGHRFTVTDAIHPSGQSFDVLDGTKGDKGDDGYSPTITITTITGGHRFTVTDKTHPSGQSFDVLDGAKGDQGDDGYSPVVTITTITGGHRVTITDKTHPSGQSFDVMDGASDAGQVSYDPTQTYPDGSVGKEVSNQKNAISELDATKAPVIINTASGDIATFADGADGMPIKHLVANIEAVQSGTGDPSPENIRPITGWTGLTGARFGINQLPPNAVDETKTSDGITITATNGVYKITGTATGNGNIIFDLANSIDLRPALNKICFFNSVSVPGIYTHFLRDNTVVHYWQMTPVNRVGSGWTDTGNEVVNKIQFSFSAGMTLNLTISPVLTLIDNDVPDFVPYVGNDTISVSWATEAGTVYGGTLDVVTGVLTVDKVMCTTTWGAGDTSGTVTDLHRKAFYPVVLTGYQLNMSQKPLCKCSIAPMVTRLDVIGFYPYAAIQFYLTLPAGTANSTAVQFYYPIAEPIVYHLDPVTVSTLLGNNTVYVDCGSVTVDYPADTGIVVAEQSNAIDELDSSFDVINPINLFNVNDQRNIEGKYVDGQGWHDQSGAFTTYPFLLKAGVKYTAFTVSAYGSASRYLAKKCDSAGNLQSGSVTGTAISGTDYGVFQSSTDQYVYFKFTVATKNRAMIVIGETAPTTYQEYFDPYKTLASDVQVTDDSLVKVTVFERAIKLPYDGDDIPLQYNIDMDGHYTKGWLKLPANYTESDEKVPLIVFVHGSADMISINSSMTNYYNDYYNYLRDCGYAIFDCYAYGNIYAVSGGNTWNTPTNKRCYHRGIEYVCKNYNIDKDNIFIACKSLGGIQAFGLYFDSTLNIKAVGMLAPFLDPIQVCGGYNTTQRTAYRDDCGLPTDTDGVFIHNTSGSALLEYLKANGNILLNNNPIYYGVRTPVDNMIDGSRENTTNSWRNNVECDGIAQRPLKIWIALDDSFYSGALNVCNSLKAGGYGAEVRAMPAGCSDPHHAVDNDPNALQITNITTRLGITYASIPTAYYELSEWFDMWLN